MYASLPSLTTTDASCHKLRVFSLHCLSQTKQRLQRNAYRARYESSPLPLLHAPYSFLLSHSPVILRIPPESLSFFGLLISSPSLSISLPLLESFASTCSWPLSPSKSTKKTFHRIGHDNDFPHPPLHPSSSSLRSRFLPPFSDLFLGGAQAISSSYLGFLAPLQSFCFFFFILVHPQVVLLLRQLQGFFCPFCVPILNDLILHSFTVFCSTSVFHDLCLDAD